MTGKRVHERYPINLGVTVSYGGQTYETQTSNVSIGGFFVPLVAPIPFGATVRVRFRIATLTEDTEVDATVRWKTAEGLGLQFGSLRALEVWGLNQLFKSHTAVG